MKGLVTYLKSHAVPLLVSTGFFALFAQVIYLAGTSVTQVKDNQDANTRRIALLIDRTNTLLTEVRDQGQELERQGKAIDCLLTLHVADNMPVPAKEIEGCRAEAQKADGITLRPTPNPQPNQSPGQGQQKQEESEPPKQSLLDNIFGLLPELGL